MPTAALLIDDDARLGALMTEYLGKHEIEVTVAADGPRGLAALRKGHTDVVLLDVMLPGADGFEVCRQIRADAALAAVPVIMLTARGDDVDKIVGLEIGADDYLAKPFNPRELLARIRTVLRRTQAHQVPSDSAAPRAFRFCEWELNLRTRRLNSTAGPVELTHTEYDLLMAFLGAPQRILTREQLLELIRGDDTEVFDRSIDVQILRLRRKIESDPSRPQLIKTERGLGYFFSAKVEIVA